MTKHRKNMGTSASESICVQEDKYCNIDTMDGIGKPVAKSVSILSNLMIEKPILLCNSNPRALVESIVDALEQSATHTKAQMKSFFLEMETSAKDKLYQNLSAPNQRRLREEPVLEFEGGCIEGKKRRRRKKKKIGCVDTDFAKTKFYGLQDYSKR